MPRIAVLGGGISGIAAAHRLLELARQHNLQLDLTVYEAAQRAGGCVQSVRSGELLLELGADSVLVNKPAARRLIDRLGIGNQIVAMQQRGAYVALHGRLHPIPPDFRLFMPQSVPSLVRSGLFSPQGLIRAACEPFIPARKSQDDETLASFVRRRLGREAMERLAQPLIGGIYSADPEQLSMEMALPQFLQYEREFGSLLRAMPHASAAGPELASFRDGTGELVDALLGRLGPVVRTNARVDAVEKAADSWRLTLANGERAQADAVVCALQAPVAATLLEPLDAQTANALNRIRCNSIAAVNLIYRKADVSLPRGSGFVVPAIERSVITAATFASQKYPYRSSDDTVLIRAFCGGALQPHALERDDDELIGAAHEALKRYVRITSAAQSASVARWYHSLPQYGLDHKSIVRSLFSRVATIGSLALAGCAYAGVGIPDCVASGEAAAESVFGYVVGAKGEPQ